MKITQNSFVSRLHFIHSEKCSLKYALLCSIRCCILNAAFFNYIYFLHFCKSFEYFHVVDIDNWLDTHAWCSRRICMILDDDMVMCYCTLLWNILVFVHWRQLPKISSWLSNGKDYTQWMRQSKQAERKMLTSKYSYFDEQKRWVHVKSFYQLYRSEFTWKRKTTTT